MNKIKPLILFSLFKKFYFFYFMNPIQQFSESFNQRYYFEKINSLIDPDKYQEKNQKDFFFSFRLIEKITIPTFRGVEYKEESGISFDEFIEQVESQFDCAQPFLSNVSLKKGEKLPYLKEIYIKYNLIPIFIQFYNKMNVEKMNRARDKYVNSGSIDEQLQFDKEMSLIDPYLKFRPLSDSSESITPWLSSSALPRTAVKYSGKTTLLEEKNRLELDATQVLGAVTVYYRSFDSTHWCDYEDYNYAIYQSDKNKINPRIKEQFELHELIRDPHLVIPIVLPSKDDSWASSFIKNYISEDDFNDLKKNLYKKKIGNKKSTIESINQIYKERLITWYSRNIIKKAAIESDRLWRKPILCFEAADYTLHPFSNYCIKSEKPSPPPNAAIMRDVLMQKKIEKTSENQTFYLNYVVENTDLNNFKKKVSKISFSEFEDFIFEQLKNNSDEKDFEFIYQKLSIADSIYKTDSPLQGCEFVETELVRAKILKRIPEKYLPFEDDQKSTVDYILSIILDQIESIRCYSLLTNPNEQIGKRISLKVKETAKSLSYLFQYAFSNIQEIDQFAKIRGL